ncbi:MAG: hypothetical protein EOO41_05290, partial [Methanobacteriota archaeon]
MQRSGSGEGGAAGAPSSRLSFGTSHPDHGSTFDDDDSVSMSASFTSDVETSLPHGAHGDARGTLTSLPGISSFQPHSSMAAASVDEVTAAAAAMQSHKNLDGMIVPRPSVPSSGIPVLRGRLLAAAASHMLSGPKGSASARSSVPAPSAAPHCSSYAVMHTSPHSAASSPGYSALPLAQRRGPEQAATRQLRNVSPLSPARHSSMHASSALALLKARSGSVPPVTGLPSYAARSRMMRAPPLAEGSPSVAASIAANVPGPHTSSSGAYSARAVLSQDHSTIPSGTLQQRRRAGVDARSGMSRSPVRGVPSLRDGTGVAPTAGRRGSHDMPVAEKLSHLHSHVGGEPNAVGAVAAGSASTTM